MPALAITDHGNLFGAIDFYRSCRKEGIKPLIGCELYYVSDHKHIRDDTYWYGDVEAPEADWIADYKEQHGE